MSIVHKVVRSRIACMNASEFECTFDGLVNNSSKTVCNMFLAATAAVACLAAYTFHIHTAAFFLGGCCFVLVCSLCLLSSVWAFVCPVIPVCFGLCNRIIDFVAVVVVDFSLIEIYRLNIIKFFMSRHRMEMPLESLTQTGRDVETLKLRKSRLNSSHVSIISLLWKQETRNASNFGKKVGDKSTITILLWLIGASCVAEWHFTVRIIEFLALAN